MKTLPKLPFNSMFILIVSSLLVSGFKVSDSCTPYYPMEKGKKFELTYFNKKDKAQGRTAYEIVESSGGGNSMMAKVHMKSFDKKDKLVFENDYEVKCENGVFEIDIRGLLNGAQMQQMSTMEGMDVTVNTNNLEMPSSMSVGDQLDDGSLEMKMNSSAGGMTIMSFNTDITNRKVVASEKVTTLAGTFDCLVITSTVSSKAGFVKMELDTKEWISKNVGLVRSETYKKGDLEGYTELTKFE